MSNFPELESNLISLVSDRRIASCGIHDPISIIEHRKVGHVQDAVIFSTEDGKIYALKKITQSSYLGFRKLAEYLNCKKMQSLGVDCPKVIYINLQSKEVVTEWVYGEPWARFDQEEQPSLPSSDELDQFQDILIKLNKHTNQDLSRFEQEPTYDRPLTNIFRARDRNTLFDQVINNYARVFPHIVSARGKGLVSRFMLDDINQLASCGLSYLRRQRVTIESVSSFSLLHGDLTPENILRTPRGVALIDYEQMHFGDIAYDLAFFFEEGTQRGFIDPVFQEHFINSYMSKREVINGADTTLKERIRVYGVYSLFKFVGLIADGLCAGSNDEVNQELLEYMLIRAKNKSREL